MEPINLYIAIVSTLAIAIVMSFYTHWWYYRLQHMQEKRERYIVNKHIDHDIMMHEVSYFAVCCLVVVALVYVWTSAWGAA